MWNPTLSNITSATSHFFSKQTLQTKLLSHLTRHSVPCQKTKTAIWL